ncbi:MAG: ribosome-associated translation inhibitor RaiA [Bacilli bacterium]|jgi:putative sigma-54 modulation protein|nr:ribosome-associated translation inhibitor RaiA [Bacilli bacterium]
MKVVVRGKNRFEPTVAITEYATEKLQKMDQYFANGEAIEANVLCKAYPDFKTVEITIPTKNIILRAEVNGETIYEAIDMAIDRLVKQISRHKAKIAKAIKHRAGVSGYYEKEMLVEESNESEDEVSKLVKNKSVDLIEMDKEDAITQMEMLGHDFYLFIDSKSHKPSVVYLRNDGNYGIIEAK